ncbi:MAG: DUF1653 domain-containing protein [Candidatus Yanofskybacteria bacterium]|nr:DUF1653 domain-containing protein [Candidatus Yanofskybacteria bacterium]
MAAKTPKEIVPGVYQHYKGPRYLVLGVARNANTEERAVVYLPLEPHGKEIPMLTYRPVGGKDGFFALAMANGKKMIRFKLLYPFNATSIVRPKLKK